VRDELADFSRHTQVYQRYDEVGHGVQSTDFRRILRDFDVSTALPLLMFLELEAGLSPDQLSASLVLMESFITRRVFTGEETKEYNKLFVDIVGALHGLTGEQVQPALEDKLLSGGGTTRFWPTDDAIMEQAVSRQVFTTLKTPALRLILERLELALRGKKSEDHAIPEGLQIEHVLPQNWAKQWPLLGKAIPENLVLYPFLAKDEFEPLSDAIRARNEKLHTLGNLTLLKIP